MVFYTCKKVFLATAALGICLAAIGIPSPTEYAEESAGTLVAIPGSQPKACFGFDRINGRGGPAVQACPADHALFSVGDDGGDNRPGRTINVTSSCCPLPSNDILTDTHVFVGEECPEDFVATGAKELPCSEEYCPVLMRCTKLNTDRYALGQTTQSLYWGNGHAGWQRSKRTEHQAIPLGIRHSVGRTRNAAPGVDGCVGYPWGSLLTKKSAKYCYGYGFRQLQFKGIGQDPDAGTAVKMFADCTEVEHPENPELARCVGQ